MYIIKFIHGEIKTQTTAMKPALQIVPESKVEWDHGREFKKIFFLKMV